jgi:hypothetical protein
MKNNSKKSKQLKEDFEEFERDEEAMHDHK